MTGIALRAGAAPRTLQRLLSVSGTPVYAFVSTAPLYETLSVNLASGAQRTNVKALQRALKADGYYSGSINGDFGTSTETALEDWQAAQGLSQTGEITTAQFVWVPKGAVIESWNVGLGSHVSSSTAFADHRLSHRPDRPGPRDPGRHLLTEGRPEGRPDDRRRDQRPVHRHHHLDRQPARLVELRVARRAPSSTRSTWRRTVLPSLARSGMTGSLTVTIASRSNVLLVPTSAVSGTSSATFVRVMMNGTPTYRQVTTGMTTSSLTQITSGLTAGEVVVTGQYTNSATSSTSTSTGGFGGLGGLGGFSGGGGFRRSQRRQLVGRQFVGHQRSMIVVLESLRMAFSSLRANPLRAVLTILGIVIGVGAVVALTSIGSGSTRAVENRFNAFGTDTITVQSSPFVTTRCP